MRTEYHSAPICKDLRRRSVWSVPFVCMVVAALIYPPFRAGTVDEFRTVWSYGRIDGLVLCGEMAGIFLLWFFIREVRR